MVELSCGHASGMFNLFSIRKTLSCQGIASEKPPPALLQIEPARSRRNEDVMEAPVLGHPGPRLRTIMAAQIIGDDENVARRIVGFDIPKQSNVVRRVA